MEKALGSITIKHTPIKKIAYIIFILNLIVINAYSQNVIDSVNYALRSNNYTKAKGLTDEIKNNDLRTLFSNQINYYLNGEAEDIHFPISKMKTKRDSIVYYFLKADAWSFNRTFDKNEEIYQNYLNGYKLSLKYKDTSLIKETLFRLCNHLVNRVREDTIQIRDYLKELNKHKKTNVDLYWFNYYKIRYNGLLKDLKVKHKLLNINEVKAFKRNEMNALFRNMSTFSKGNDFQQANYFKILSSYQSDWLKEYSEANINMEKAKNLYNKFHFWYAFNRAKGLDYNRALNYFKNGDYEKAIPVLEKDLLRDKESIYIMHTYEYLYLCYKAKENLKKALFNFEEMHKVKEELDQKKYAIAIRRINEKYNKVAIENELKIEKEKNISLEEKKESLETNVMTLTPILGLTTITLVFIFYLYKRYKKKSNILEEEQSETLQKLDELKNIVIKNHIILKDKTKVYISDLMYIKSDDHYLEIITQDGKRHTVRGKLSQIKEELPPNFIQCHRSYIVNSNFIKQIITNGIVLINKEQIPLSRSYKKKF